VVSGDYMTPENNGIYNTVRVNWTNSATARRVFCNLRTRLFPVSGRMPLLFRIAT